MWLCMISYTQCKIIIILNCLFRIFWKKSKKDVGAVASAIIQLTLFLFSQLDYWSDQFLNKSGLRNLSGFIRSVKWFRIPLSHCFFFTLCSRSTLVQIPPGYLFFPLCNNINMLWSSRSVFLYLRSNCPHAISGILIPAFC